MAIKKRIDRHCNSEMANFDTFNMNRYLVVFCLITLTCQPIIAADVMGSDARTKPLLMDGKRHLYQRILTLPKATLYPGRILKVENPIPLPAFSPYYVYHRKTDKTKQKWLQIGLGRKGDIVGWVSADKVMDWNHGLTLTFRKPDKEKDRVLLFRDRESIKEIAESYNQTRYEHLFTAANKGQLLKDSPVVAIQPLKNIDIRDNFYLLPIHDFEEFYVNNSTARLLKVSSITLQDESSETIDKPKTASKTSASYTANIVFVIDSTLSMGPYIKRMQEAVYNIYDTLKKKSLLGAVQFGLIAFRDNPGAAPQIDYLTRQYVSLKQGINSSGFINSVESLQPSLHPSKDFIEDSYAGINAAIKDMDWATDAARFIVLITDAGARDKNDPLASTGLDAAKLNQLAQDNNIAIFVLHLLTPDLKADHESAGRQYRQLSKYPGIGNLYYAVPTGSLNEYGQVLDSLAGQITNQITQLNVVETTQPQVSQPNPQLNALQAKVAKLGHALRMRYLKNVQNEKVPDVIDAWLLDKNFYDIEKSAVDVRVLLTRDQLSDLYNVLTQVLETAEQGLISPSTFLGELKSLAATIARDPQLLGGTTATTSHGSSLAELGFVREYIEDLPYTGEVMNLSLQDWQSWSVSQQTGFLQRLEEKITYYQALHDHVDLWVNLAGGPIDGDSVFPIPLEMLP